MDFSLSEEQEAIRSLARQILSDLVSPERHKELEADDQWFDRKAWSALADAGLLGIAAPDAFGGSNLGFLEVALVLEEVGRTVAKVPYLASVVMGILPIAQFGDEALQREWLPKLVAGEAIASTRSSKIARRHTRRRRPPARKGRPGCSTAPRPACLPVSMRRSC